MKIVHVYAANMQMFIDAVNGTDCRLHGSDDVDYMIKSLQLYNARDVLGLIVFANPMTKKCIRLIKSFDDMFVFKKLPIIIINDAAAELYSEGHFKVKNSKLYLINSEDNSISDIDLRKIFVTLIGSSAQLYDLSGCNLERRQNDGRSEGNYKDLKMSDSLADLLKTLSRGDIIENRSSSGSNGAGAANREEEPSEETLSALEGFE